MHLNTFHHGVHSSYFCTGSFGKVAKGIVHLVWIHKNAPISNTAGCHGARPGWINRNKFTTKFIKPVTLLSANQSCSTFGGLERRQHGDNRATGGRKIGQVVLWASCCCLCSGVKLACVKGRTAKSPNPEQISPTNCTALQKVLIFFLPANFPWILTQCWKTLI